jgi:beta-phosphoglucomutase-like phosphatase (HAD superfamily)
MPSPNHSAVIFDMDGVIIDSEPRHERAFLDVFAQMGYGQTHGIQFEQYLGRSDRAVWLDFIAQHNPKWTLDELTAWKQNHIIEIIRREQPIFDGLPELVAKLAPRYRLAVASGSVHPVIDEVLAMKSLRRFFPVVVSTQDVAHGKPAPDVFLRAAELLGVAPAACCVIEDSAAGVTAARAAGMTAIAITNTLPAEKLTHAHHVVRTYGEVERLLLPA